MNEYLHTYNEYAHIYIIETNTIFYQSWYVNLCVSLVSQNNIQKIFVVNKIT